MRSPRLILDGSVCQGDFVAGVNSTIDAELHATTRQDCRFFPSQCPALKPGKGPLCIQRAGQEVARYVIKLGSSVEDELVDFRREAPLPPGGYFDPKIHEPADAIHDKDHIVLAVGKAAREILDIQDADSASLNHEYSVEPRDLRMTDHSVLGESVHDPVTHTWLHSCGTILAAAQVRRQIMTSRLMPLAGTGKVRTENRPYCPTCSGKPPENGSPVYEEDERDPDVEILMRIERLGKPS